MSRLTIGILFAVIGLVVAASLWDFAHFGGGAGVLIVAALCYSFVVAKRDLNSAIYVLSEDQIIDEPEAQAV